MKRIELNFELGEMLKIEHLKIEMITFTISL